MNFFDDLNKLNQGTEDNEFSDLNNEVYNEHNYILSLDKNPEFFDGLCNMLKHEKVSYNTSGFTQEDLDKIKYIHSSSYYFPYFQNVTSLDELQYFHNLKYIGPFCFSECKNLKSIILPKNLEKISENSFSRCSSLKEIKFPQNLKEINSVAFSHTPLKEIIFPKNIRIIHLGFLFCTSLKKIIIPKRFKNDIKDIFFGVDLTKVNITYI